MRIRIPTIMLYLLISFGCNEQLGQTQNDIIGYENQETKEKIFPLNNGRELIITTVTDSSIWLNDHEVAQKEYYRISTLDSSFSFNSDKQNLLNIIVGNYYRASLVEGVFKVVKPCDESIPKITIFEKEPGDYSLTYHEDSLIFEKQIVSTNLGFTLQGKIEEIENYQGRYIQFWLKDKETGEMDSRFVALGNSKERHVLEFHFPYKGPGIYYVSEKNMHMEGIQSIEEICN
jgi:hypothetical protein